MTPTNDPATDATASAATAKLPSPTPHTSRRPPGSATVYQTTGPEAYTGPIMSADGSGNPRLNPRSCVTCRRRKVRCDKQMPCSNCRRALIPCVFPAPGRAPRQPRPKDPNAPPKPSSQREAELVKRLRKLEGIVEELSSQLEVESGGKGPSSSSGSPNNSPSSGTQPVGGLWSARRAATTGAATATATAAAAAAAAAADFSGGATSQNLLAVSRSAWDKERGADDDFGKTETHAQLGRLVLNDHKGNTRYVSNGFWARLNDELTALREDTRRLSDEDSDETDYEESPAETPERREDSAKDHHGFILGYRSADVNLRAFHPMPSHVPFLWSVYQENVEPIVKILHVPTADAIMRDARKYPDKLTPGQEALVFAIYFSAVVSLTADEIMSNFNVNRDDLLRQHRFALEQSLAKANYLHTSDLVVLQAFTLLLLTARRVDHSRFCWTLTSLVVRIAKGMGLHRDGSQFDLTPFETEVRRRVWWAIVMLDLRSTEELGTELTIAEATFDTEQPLNINDTDISPSSKEWPQPREGRSDMSLALARYEIATFSRKYLAQMVCKGGVVNRQEMDQLLGAVYRKVETKFFTNVEETDSQMYTAGLICRVIAARMTLHLYQSRVFPGASTGLPEETRNRVFAAAIEVVEVSRTLMTDPKCEQFRWLFMTYTSWHAITFNLIEVCRRAWSPIAERSWQAVASFERDAADMAKAGHHNVIFLPLRKLYVRARKHREAEVARLRSDPDRVRRLDYEYQTNHVFMRLNPIPGPENRAETAREKWWALVQPDRERAAWVGSPGAMVDSPEPSATTGNITGSDAQATTAQPQAMSSEAMQILEDMLSQPTNPAITTLYGLDMPATPTTTTTTTAATTTAAAAAAAGPSPQRQHRKHTEDNSLRQQALALQAQATAVDDDDLPPFMWSHPWGGTENGPSPSGAGAGAGAGVGADADAGAMDVTLDSQNENVNVNGNRNGIGSGSSNADQDVMDSGFDWQDWSQTLHFYDNLGHPGAPFGSSFT